MRHARVCVIGLSLALALLVAPRVWAQPTVLVVAAGGSKQELSPFELRLHSELLAAGFSVTSVQLPSAPDPEALQRTASGMLTKAAVTVVLSAETVSGVVWATARDSDKTLVKPIHPVPLSADAPSVLAIRATELLNAVLIELGYPKPRPSEAGPEDAGRSEAERDAEPAMETAPRSPLPAPSAQRARPARPVTRRGVDESSWSVGAGAMVLGGPGGIPVAAAVAILGSWRVADGWYFGALATGPLRGTVRNSKGVARLDQELALARLRWQGRLTKGLDGFAVLGLGGHRLGVRGEAEAPYRGTSDQVLSGAAVVGAGLRLSLTRSLLLRVETDAGLTAPRAEVVIDRRAEARTGRPLAGAGLFLELAL